MSGPVTICYPFVGDSVGGSHLSSMLLIANLDRARFRPLIVLHEEGPLADELKRRGMDFQLMPLSQYAGSTPKRMDNLRATRRAVPTIVRLLREQDVDIVHTNDLRMHLTWALATKLAGRKFVNHQRVILSRSPLWRVLAFFASRIICISGAVFNSLPVAGQRKSRIIANPLDNAAVPQARALARQALLAELGLPDDAVLVGYVGNMTRQKRPLVFLKSAAEIANDLHANVHFVMVGDNRGRELDAARVLSRQLKLDQKTHFLGFRLPIEPIIAAFDLLVAPGVNDAFGRTVAEAMLTGTPVVASASGGHIELLENGRFGLLALPDDHLSFAMCSLRLLENQDLARRLVEAATSEACTVYSIDEHVQNISAVYEELLPMRVAPASPVEA